MLDVYCLANFIDYSSIHEPLKHSNRIKYTCFDISANYIIFGATSGSLYLFNRSNGKFLHLIPNKHGAVSYLAISANEKYVAFATQRSLICVYAVNLSAHAAPQVIHTNHLSNDQSVQVTCIQWTQDEKQFYYGDTKGQVNLVQLTSFMGTSLLNMTVHPILYLDSPIVQLDNFESLLLVSNCSKCILCNTEYEEYKQIGNRPRDGPFGACFNISHNEPVHPSRIYCARPGSRLWEVDFEGNVIQTHQFKAALATPPSKIHKSAAYESENEIIDKFDENDEMLDYQPQNLIFGKVQMLTQDFLLAYTELGLYIFDVSNSSVVLWCNQFERIVDVRVVGREIVIFTQTGSLYSVQLHTLQAYACQLVREEQLLKCAYLMRKHVKYFADRAREDYELGVLNQIKNFLISRQSYELLNDLSVIFDAIAQCEGNGDNHSSGGSSGRVERSSSLSSNGTQCNVSQEPHNPKGVYVLENAFCDNLKSQRNTEKHLKDALLTVTGKFGKNIIKYKFNIFAEDQQKLVRELIPTDQRSMPFKDVKALYEHEEEIVCRTKKSSQAQSRLKPVGQHISAEEKTIYNLYLICKSAKISNTNFVDRYRALFDEYTARELINLLSKLEQVMYEYGDSPEQAKQNCFEMYFNYLNPELIWEMDDETRNYIAEGFVLLNANTDIVRCDNCTFPLRFDNSCLYHEVGAVLLRFYWSRNDQVKCFDVLMQVPAVFDVLAKFYLAENNLHKVLPIVLNFGKPALLLEFGRSFSLEAWGRCFEHFVEMTQGRLSCVNCECITEVENVSRHFFYTWNCFLSIALEYLEPNEILTFICRWASDIPNDAIDREFFTKCLLKA